MRSSIKFHVRANENRRGACLPACLPALLPAMTPHAFVGMKIRAICSCLKLSFFFSNGHAVKASPPERQSHGSFRDQCVPLLCCCCCCSVEMLSIPLVDEFTYAAADPKARQAFNKHSVSSHTTFNLQKFAMLFTRCDRARTARVIGGLDSSDIFCYSDYKHFLA
jgi:hypothetical protein